MARKISTCMTWKRRPKRDIQTLPHGINSSLSREHYNGSMYMISKRYIAWFLATGKSPTHSIDALYRITRKRGSAGSPDRTSRMTILCIIARSCGRPGSTVTVRFLFTGSFVSLVVYGAKLTIPSQHLRPVSFPSPDPARGLP